MVKILPLEAKTPKIEFGRAYTNSVSITESHNPEILMISPAYESAKKALPLAAELKVNNQKQPLTKAQMDLMDKIKNTISPLLRHLRALSLMADSENKAAVELVYEYVNRHLSGFGKENSYKQIGVLSSLLNGIEDDPNLKQAIESLNLTQTFATIVKDKKELDTVYEERRKVLSIKQKAHTQKTKRKLYFLLRQLFTAIELAAIEHPELDYSLLVNELNKEVERCNASNKKRSTTTTPAGEETLPTDEQIV